MGENRNQPAIASTWRTERATMLVCSNPIFERLHQSKAPRFISVPGFRTVACCECIEEDMFYVFKHKRAKNLARHVEEAVGESSCAIYTACENHIFELRRVNKINLFIELIS